MCHIRYMIARARKQEQVNLDMEDYVKEKFPEAYRLAQNIYIKGVCFLPGGYKQKDKAVLQLCPFICVSSYINKTHFFSGASHGTTKVPAFIASIFSRIEIFSFLGTLESIRL